MKTVGIETPTLRLYGWSPSAVSIGYFQSVEQEVNSEICEKTGIDVVRRITGGGAVLHDFELTYSFITRKYPQNILESYILICDPIIRCLANLGFDEPRFVPLNDVLVDGKKVSGNAQTRKEGILLQHGTILLDVDIEKMFRVLKIPQQKIQDKLISDVKQRVRGLNRTFEQVSVALEQAFSTKFAANLVIDKITSQECVDAQMLIETKYGTHAWNWKR
ncbi:MAG TPA: biotin/lipoate A/B protein ligase family protein [Candidatus Nitrosopolaris sp.]|nr:biotin/lipoate A/B protein ligase family protein [Candidatus Nitrosopolaris sp.]